MEMYSLWKDAIHIGMEDGRKKGKEEGIKTGREAGIKEGIKTGRREGQQMLILHLLQNVLGQLTPEIKKRIQQCDEHMLQVIGMKRKMKNGNVFIVERCHSYRNGRW